MRVDKSVHGIRPSTGCVVLLFTDIATENAVWVRAAINWTSKFVGTIRIPFPVPIVIGTVTPALPLPRRRRRHSHSQTHNLHLIDFVFTEREFAYALLSALTLLLLPSALSRDRC